MINTHTHNTEDKRRQCLNFNKGKKPVCSLKYAKSPYGECKETKVKRLVFQGSEVKSSLPFLSLGGDSYSSRVFMWLQDTGTK